MPLKMRQIMRIIKTQRSSTTRIVRAHANSKWSRSCSSRSRTMSPSIRRLRATRTLATLPSRSFVRLDRCPTQTTCRRGITSSFHLLDPILMACTRSWPRSRRSSNSSRICKRRQASQVCPFPALKLSVATSLTLKLSKGQQERCLTFSNTSSVAVF